MGGALLEEGTFIGRVEIAFSYKRGFLLVGVVYNGWCYGVCFCGAGVVSWEVVTSFLH